MSKAEKRPRIFVQIASYRDAECHHTITDLFEKAALPERISVGICWQYDPQQDAAMLAVPYPRMQQVRAIQFHSNDSQGAGWARMQAQSLWQGEEYTLQISSHTRFEQGWDETLLALLGECPGDKTALTAWLPGYTPPEKKEKLTGGFLVAVAERFTPDYDPQLLQLGKRMKPVAMVRDKLLPTPFWLKDFLFTRSSTIAAVAPDPHLYGLGEEITYAARLWTHGYDVYHLNLVVLYSARTGTYENLNEPHAELALKRVRHMLALEKTDDMQARKRLDYLGLGRERTIESFWEFAGIDLSAKTISEKARKGEWQALAPAPVAKKTATAAATAKKKPAHPRIFVAMSSCRDAQTQATVEDLFAKATLSERIHLGVCVVADEKKDKACLLQTPFPKQTRMTVVAPAKSKGANWVRAQAMSFGGDEEYVLQIDSHMRFEAGWDEALIEMLGKCPAQKAVITGVLNGYEPPNKLVDNAGTIAQLTLKAAVDGLVAYGRYDAPVGTLAISGGVVSHFVFAPRAAYDEVPFDAAISADDAMLNQSARLWTHGWDFFQPERNIAYHYRDHAADAGAEPFLSRTRNLHVLGLAAADETALAEIDKYTLGNVRSIADYWHFIGVQPFVPEVIYRPRIFVNMVSYRDRECQPTIDDLFAKATHPERVNIGICWQADKKAEPDLGVPSHARAHQLRVIEFDVKDAQGAGWARMQAQTLWQGEEYTLQVQAHMRFEAGWDEALLDMLARCPSANPLISTYVPAYKPPQQLTQHPGKLFRVCVADFTEPNNPQMLNLHKVIVDENDAQLSGLYPCPFWIGNFLFSPSRLLQEVPHDPHIYFLGEEQAYSARLYTHGWDIFQPERTVAYHYWLRDKTTASREHYNSPRNKSALARVRHLLAMKPSNKPEIIAELDRYGLGTVRTLEQFWHFAGLDWNTRSFTKEAAKGVWNMTALAAPALAAQPQPEKPIANAARIFVNIASYRDAECQATLDNLFAQAAHPERLQVGICLQIDPGADTALQIYSDHPQQVRIIQVDYRESLGVSWARAQAHTLWSGEEYILQIDSHMRFERGWDELLVAMAEQAPSPRAVISTYAPRYTPPETLSQYEGEVPRLRAHMFAKKNMPQLLLLAPTRVPQERGLYRSPFVIGHFIFAPAQAFVDVPYDPQIPFWGDEISTSARLWTHGYDVYQPDRVVLYHYWKRDELISVQPFRNPNNKQTQLSYQRVRHLLGLEQVSDARAIAGLEHYALGTKRPLAELWAFAGIDWHNQQLSEDALQGRWNVPEILPEAAVPEMVPVTLEVDELIEVIHEIQSLPQQAEPEEQDIMAEPVVELTTEEDEQEEPEEAVATQEEAEQEPTISFIAQAVEQDEPAAVELQDEPIMQAAEEEVAVVTPVIEEAVAVAAKEEKAPEAEKPKQALALPVVKKAEAAPLVMESIADAMKKNKTKKPAEEKLPRIFVNIASYRDPECQWTVKDLFEKATHPDRIFVGICWQFDPAEDAHCFTVSTRPEQVRVFPVNWWEAEGVCWARRMTQLLWEDEEYTLMIDSHMRFVHGWDELMIAELAKCPSDKPLLSCNPPRYMPPMEYSERVHPTVRRVKPFYHDGTIRCHGEWVDMFPPHPLNGAFLVANFIFSRSEITTEVPYDPYLYFSQEEITYALRLYTHGWDIFSPTRQFLYHQYNDGLPGSPTRSLHWDDMLKEKEYEKKITFLKKRAMDRFNHITEHKISDDPAVLEDLDIYGLGTVRTLDEFREYSGLDLKNKIATDRALRCFFIKDFYKFRRKPIHIPELDGDYKPQLELVAMQPAMQHAAVKQPETPTPREDVVKLVTSMDTPKPVPQAAAHSPLVPRDPRVPAIQATSPLSMFETGDFVPFFGLKNHEGHMRNIDPMSGRHIILMFLPADAGYIDMFLKTMDILTSAQPKEQVHTYFIVDAGLEEMKSIRERLKLPHLLMADSGRKVAQAFGLCRENEAVKPTGFVVNPNMRILTRHMQLNPAEMASVLVQDMLRLLAEYKHVNREPRIITQQAPVLIVPNVLSTEQCEKYIHAFDVGKQFEGTVGAFENRRLVLTAKSRTDHIIEIPELLREMDDKFARAVFPEIKRVFGFEVSHREKYKIGKYIAENGGFFRQHRDNFDSKLGYRRVAMTLQLNDDYEGGGICFPEYSDDVYRPTRGSAIIFPCGLMHEACTVTKGARIIIVGFFHGLQDEAYRRDWMIKENLNPHVINFTPTLRHYTDINEQRHKYDKWYKENMRFFPEELGEIAEIVPVKKTVVE